jgi:hypothetical protein
MQADEEMRKFHTTYQRLKSCTKIIGFYKIILKEIGIHGMDLLQWGSGVDLTITSPRWH